jgi:hypothetical protein
MSIRAGLLAGGFISVRAKACMSFGFLTAEASLQGNSRTMQARRPQVTRMLKFGVVGRTGAANNSAVHWPSSNRAASLNQSGNSNIASLVRPSNYEPSTMRVWGRI